MADVFISYSRKDGEFVQHLNTAFVGANRVVWIDWQSIPRGEDWWLEIARGIEDADSFICTVSEHWLMSEICHKELEHARKQNKRVLPLIRQQVRDDIEKRVKGTWMDTPYEQMARDNWDYIRHLNWIFFDVDEKFDAEFAALLKTLDEDQPHIKAHTRYLTDALEWERSGRNPSFLMTGDNLNFAEQWLKESAGKTPQPTETQQKYITASRQAEDEQKARNALIQRRVKQFLLASRLLGFMAFLALGAAAVYGIWGIQAQERANLVGTQVFEANATMTPIPITLTAFAEQIQNAEERVESLRLVGLANGEIQNGNRILASLLSVRALSSGYTQEADALLFRALSENTARLTLGESRAAGRSAVYSPDGRFIVTASGVSAIIWNAATGEQVRILNVYPESERTMYDSVNSAFYSPDGRFIVTTDSIFRDRLAIIWDAATGEQVRILNGHIEAMGYRGPPNYTIEADYSLDGQFLVTIATSDTDSTCIIWNAQTGEQVHILDRENLRFNSVDYSPDGHSIVTVVNPLTDDNAAIIWDAQTGEPIRTLQSPTASFHGAVYSPDARFILSVASEISSDNTATIWDAQTGEQMRVLYGHTNVVRSAVYSPDGDYILTASDDTTAIIWNSITGERLYTLGGHTDRVNNAVYSPDGRSILTAGEMIVVWDALVGQQVNILIMPSNGVRRAIYSPDGNFMLTISRIDNTIIAWNAETNEQLYILGTPADAVRNAVYSPDGNFILTTHNDNTAFIWTAETGEQLYALSGPTFGVTGAAYSLNGTFIITTSGNGTAIIWDANIGQPLRTLQGRTGWISSIEYNVDGHYIAASGLGNTDITWDTNYQDFITYACERLAPIRDFTDEERQLIGIDDTPTCPQFADAVDQ